VYRDDRLNGRSPDLTSCSTRRLALPHGELGSGRSAYPRGRPVSELRAVHRKRPPLLTYDGGPHTAVFNGDACADNAVVRYVDTAVAPPASLQCGS
jgi:hypothetical protein